MPFKLAPPQGQTQNVKKPSNKKYLAIFVVFVVILLGYMIATGNVDLASMFNRVTVANGQEASQKTSDLGSGFGDLSSDIGGISSRLG